MFGISDDDLLSNGIKIIDGIAGGAKSSKIDYFFKSNDIEYQRLTSTNRLSKDASIRYNMPVKTIAAGLFTNNGGNFYTGPKSPESKYVVIDEILQTNTRVIDWCLDNADTTDIIITTDSRQLLAPENADIMQEAFDKLKYNPNVIYKNVTKTLRARNKKTEKLYNQFYELADQPVTFSAKGLIETFENVIDYKDMEYDPHNAYITHDNLTEDYLYRDKEFCSNPNLDLIPKGYLASNTPKDLTKYPLLSQIEANRTHITAYTQVMNVGSAVRFQGSEVTDTQKLYFLIQPDSVVSARELYTVITRMWDINSFVIVLVDTPVKYTLTTFKDKPVKKHKYLLLNEDHNTEIISEKSMNKMLAEYDTDEYYYDRTVIRNYKGKALYKCNKNIDNVIVKSNKQTAGSLARRDSALKYSYMDEVYSVLDNHNLDHLTCIQAGGRTKDKFEADIYSAYPTIMKHENMPIDGMLKLDGPHDDMINFYVYKGKDYFTPDSIITDDMNEYITSNNIGETEYLFSTPCKKGCMVGDVLYAKAFDTVESKKDIKDIHYGYYQKPYLELSFDRSCYVKHETHIYGLFICHIFSQLLYYMLKVKDAINGTSIYVDAVEFSCYDDSVAKTIRSTLPDYFDFRIKENPINEKFYTVMPDGTWVETDRILYQTYSNLKTKSEKRAEQKKNWEKNMTEEQKAKRNAQRRKRYAERKKVKENEQ